jgi:preprotein translocase subunit SecA
VTRYKVEFELATLDSNGLTDKKIAQVIKDKLGDNIPGRSRWALSSDIRLEKVETVADVLLKPVDERWKMILQRGDELAKEYDLTFSTRTSALTSSNGKVLQTQFTFYPNGQDNGVRWVFNVGVRTIKKKGVETDEVFVEGPYEDHGFQFWMERVKKFQKDKTNVIIAGHTYYGVKADEAEKDHDLAGHGGSQFRFKMIGDFKVSDDIELYSDDDNKIVTSRNVWHGGPIPPMFHDLLPDNAVIIQARA